MKNLNIDNIEKLLKSEPSEKLLFKALKGLKVKKKDKKGRWILRAICAVLGFTMGMHFDTVDIFRESVDSILNVLLALFGVVFTGYALFQAFMNKELLFQLLTDTKIEENNEEKSRLQDVNENFVYLMLLYVVASIATLIIKIIMLCVADDFMLFTSMIANNIIAGVLITGYFIFAGIILWRTVSFVSSIFQLFNVYAVTQVMETLEEESKKDI